jgi:protein SCO1/2
MKAAACLFWLGCLLGCAPALAERLPQQANTASAGWPLGAFSLTDHRGAPFTLDNLHGRWTLLLLGDSRCGAPCDAALSALAGLTRRIQATQASKTVQVVMVALGEEDLPERLGAYLARFDPRFIGASGSRSMLQGLADDLGVALADSPDAPRNGAGSIWVIGPDGIVRSELLPPFDVPLLTAEFLKTRARR